MAVIAIIGGRSVPDGNLSFSPFSISASNNIGILDSFCILFIITSELDPSPAQRWIQPIPSLLIKLMKAKGNHDDCIEQSVRLLNERLYATDLQLDAAGRIRIDDWEMQDDIQAAVEEIWPKITTETLRELSDYER